MKSIYPPKTEGSPLSSVPGREAIKSPDNAHTAEATQAAGTLKALDDEGLLGLVIIDELHQ